MWGRVLMNDEDDISTDDIQEGMALMAGLTKKLIVDMVNNEFDDQYIILNVLDYLEDFVNISPEIVNQFFKDHDGLDQL